MQWRDDRLPVLSGNWHGSKNPEGVGTFASVTLISVQNFPNTKLCKKLNPICTETSKHPEPSHQFSIIRGLNHCQGVAKRLNIVFTIQSVPSSISLGSCGQKGHLGRGWGVVGKVGGHREDWAFSLSWWDVQLCTATQNRVWSFDGWAKSYCSNETWQPVLLLFIIS